MREVIKEARNVEDAIELACKELGVQRDAVDFEIITLPKRGFLGLRNTPARVRVFINEPEPAPEIKKEKQPVPRAEQTPSGKEQKADRVPQTERRPQKPVSKPEPKHEQPLHVQSESVKKQEKSENTASDESAKAAQTLMFVAVEQVEGKARVAAEYVRGVLKAMEIDADLSVAKTENGVVLRLSGEGLGVIIGRRGETLDALQYLSSLVANREEGDYIRVTIDSGNYREKRERTLEQLAQKLAAGVLRYGRSSTLEPMNPYERRIIHSTVAKIDGVTSSSTGEEPNRRVVISPMNPRPQQGGGRGGRGGRGRTGANRGPRRDDRAPRSGEHSEERSARPPRRERGPRRVDRAPRGETVKPTSTEVDRAYAAELEREGTLERSAQPKPKTEQKPVRQQARHEGDDLPLYGKIDL
ncbi:RNA-binding cell elongation regulator Jag/EloR [Anaerotruncus sp.]|jgi:predicted RNA-binding protein Jag|uniref:RNA-binding cell elongation regulator Jag/EloR n=1 Tax=Anaerotruncus TaxID=244127 RepID=UPI00216F9B18|nr:MULTISPECIES: RNA-binding cell elongation regulator Jag/EloR [Anaerotruncus]MCI8491951.1 protein jag [Anaerotruncus sp.]